MKSLCKTCNKELAVSALNCTTCGDVDPFLKKQISQLNSNITFVEAIEQFGSIFLVLLILGMSLSFKSWTVLFVCVGGMIFIWVPMMEKLVNKLFEEMQTLIDASFGNYMKVNINYSDDQIPWEAFSEFSTQVIGKKIKTSSNLHGGSICLESFCK